MDSSQVRDCSVDEMSLLSKHAPSPASDISAENSPIRSFKYREVWQRAFNKLRAKLSIARLGRDIQLFGASTVAQDPQSVGQNEDFIRSLVEKTVIVGKEEEKMGWMFRPGSRVVYVWSILYFLLMIYTAFVMPYRLAFFDSQVSSVWTILDTSINSLFFIDILMTFNTAQVRKGVLVTGRWEVFLTYLKSWLIVDVIACIPFSLFEPDPSSGDSGSGNFTGLMRLGRLPRIYRLLRLTRVLKMMKGYSGWQWSERLQELLRIKHSAMRLALFLVTVIIALHLMSCLWFFVGMLEGLAPDTWVGTAGLIDETAGQQYVAALYWAITTLATVGYGDITPNTTLERIVSIIWMIFGLCFFSFTVSSLSSMLNSIDTKESLLSTKLAAIDEFSDESHLSKELRLKLRYALRYFTLKTGFSSQVKQGVFAELPRELRYEVALAMHHGAAKNIPFFRERDQAFIASIVPFLNSLQVNSHCPVYEAGEYADELYFLARGRCLMMFRDLVMRKLEQGSYFGEIEVLMGIPRKHTVLSSSTSDLLSMSKKLLHAIEGDFPAIFDEIRQIAEIRNRSYAKTTAKFRELFGTVPMSPRSPQIVIAPKLSPEDEELPLLNAKEACKRSEERLDSLESSITRIKENIEKVVKVLSQDSLPASPAP